MRGKIFATAPPDGDHLHVFVDADERERALAMDPAFLEPLPWGAHIVGLRVNLALAMPPVVERLLFQAWAHKAPLPGRSRATIWCRAGGKARSS